MYDTLRSGESAPKRGFKLTDVIVVSGILAAVIVTVFPMVDRSRKASQQTACFSNLHQIGQATALYQQDYNGDLPPENPFTRGRQQEIIGAYVKKRDTLSCPSDPRMTYHWRYELDLTDRHITFIPPPNAQNHRRVQPQPESVLAYCITHLERGYSRPLFSNGEIYTEQPANKREGDYFVLREDGSVTRVNARNVSVWSYEQKNGSDIWTPLSYTKAGTDSAWTFFDVFPGEPWPPKLK